MDLVENESKFTQFLFESEMRGIPVDPTFLRIKEVHLLREAIRLRTEIAAMVGKAFNPASSKQVKEFFEIKNKIAPLAWTKPNDKGEVNSSWGADALEQINSVEHGEVPHMMAKKILDLSEVETAKSNFCESWLQRLDESNHIHADFKQHGTKTSRLSAGDPNVQNFPEWMLEALLIPEGYVGIKWDLSQIEYRMFAAYSNNPVVNALYKENPFLDFHQARADMLGFPRKPIKPINFGIIYGMGEKKTQRSILGVLSEVDSPKFRSAIVKYSGGLPIPEYPNPITSELGFAVAKNVLKGYHETMPEIKMLFAQVKQKLQACGWVRNYFGRRYYIPTSKSYVGLNAIIQGGAADLFKQALVELHIERCPNVFSIDNIHDSDFSICRIDEVQGYVNEVQDIMASTPFSIPVLADFEVATGRWSNSLKVKDAKNVKASYEELREINAKAA
jgi:DNA polymerase-1